MKDEETSGKSQEEHNDCVIMDASGFLVTMKSIQVKADVVNHPYGSVTIALVLALCPQNRFIRLLWIIGYQLLETDS
ncbi:hypothetical protein NL676_017198 [Syzygium grande]|nr:hypothetical protein NL676_017198 [Syzygium grande]